MDQQKDTTTLEKQAIQAALNDNWEEAIDFNLEIVELNPKDISSLNRLGTAYIKTSQSKLARRIFNQVLKTSPYNSIAARNLSNLKHQSKNSGQAIPQPSKPISISFVEEPGISKIIPLIKPGSPQTITSLKIGQAVSLKSSARRIKVFSEDTKEYIGRLPDNLSLNLCRLIKLGYKYQVFMKSTNPQIPKVFVQETKRSKRLNSLPSFPLSANTKTINLPDRQAVSHPLQIFDPLTKED